MWWHTMLNFWRKKEEFFRVIFKHLFNFTLIRNLEVIN